MSKYIIYVNLYCRDSEGKAFEFEYPETIESELKDINGQFNHLISGAIEEAIKRVGNEYPNANVNVIHTYKIKEGY